MILRAAIVMKIDSPDKIVYGNSTWASGSNFLPQTSTFLVVGISANTLTQLFQGGPGVEPWLHRTLGLYEATMVMRLLSPPEGNQECESLGLG